MLTLFTIAVLATPTPRTLALDPLTQELSVEKVRLLYETPTTGQSTTYSFSETSDVTVDKLRSTMNGEVLEMKAPDRSVQQLVRRVWVDTPLSAAEGPTLRRTFVDIGASMEISNHRQGAPRPDGSAVATSPLTGATVDFVETESGHLARLPEDSPADLKGDSSAGPPFPLPGPDLGALRSDSSLQRFLPQAKIGSSTNAPVGVAIGEEWSVDASAMLGVLCPGGDIPSYYGPIENQRDPDYIARFGAHAVSRFSSAIQGDVDAKLVSAESIDGTHVARIEVTFDVSLNRDPAPWMRAQSAPFEMAKIGQTAKNASHTMTAKGKATLLWDLENNRFIEFAATADTTSDQRLDYDFEHRGFKLSGEEHFEFSGTTSVLLKAAYGE